MITSVPLLTQVQINRLPGRARDVVESRKSGLSLNHVQGCPLDCAYCIRHTYGLWDQRQPRALMTDAEAVAELVGHRYFQPDVTPVQLFNRATDPFLPAVRPHTFAVLEDLDARRLTNHVLIITRHAMKPGDVERLNHLRHLKVTLLFTYSGLVAHNAHVDVDVMRRKLPGWQCPEVFDTLKLARRLLAGHASYRLGALVEAFNLADRLPDDLTPHRATYDVLVTAQLFVRLATSLSLEDLAGRPGRARDRRTVEWANRGLLCRELTEAVTGRALACLYAADRYHHLEAVIQPHLEAGQTVISDRYVPSALVMQRFDGIDPAFLWHLNAEADRPHLAVILEADPEVIAERLEARGAHNRFQLSPGSSYVEAAFYVEATERLLAAGFAVLRLDCNQRPPEQSAVLIRERLTAFFTAVSE